jgi:PiT family inorganic phosphate transporter
LVGFIPLLVVVVGFAWNLGVHYTGAVMGMPRAARAISDGPALVLIAILTILGATFASGGVEVTVGQNIVPAGRIGIAAATVIVLAAGALTMLFNYLKIPTSTIQILIFCVVGVGLAGNIPIAWATIISLAIVWVIAPVVAFVLDFVFTSLFDLLVPLQTSRAQATEQIAALKRFDTPNLGNTSFARWLPAVAMPLSAGVRQEAEEVSSCLPASVTLLYVRWLPALLVAVGMAASFVLGANDVSNATGALIMTQTFSLREAGLMGGVAMAVGALTWGRHILRTVAFDVVEMDLAMASAAQGVQALVVLAAVSQGLFTSMNQALIGAMAGTGLARGKETVQRRQIVGIFRGWLIGPASGVVLAYLLEWLARIIVG